MTSYLYSLFMNYATKVMLFFYIQTKNNIFFEDSNNFTYYSPKMLPVLPPGWLPYCPSKF